MTPKQPELREVAWRGELDAGESAITRCGTCGSKAVVQRVNKSSFEQYEPSEYVYSPYRPNISQRSDPQRPNTLLRGDLEAVIEEIRSERCDAVPDNDEDQSYNRGLEDEIQVLRAHWPRPEAEKWISVEDRLPEEDSEILFFVPSEGEYGITCGWAAGIASGKPVFETVSGQVWEPRDISHWQPLPEPPKIDQSRKSA